MADNQDSKLNEGYTTSDYTQRTFHNVAGAQYKLPNDAPEHHRLEEQAFFLSKLMSDKIIHSPLSSPPSKLLDVGCGTGVVTNTLAKQWPEVEAIGLDLTPVPKISGRVIPPNVSFMQGNVLDLGKPGQEKVVEGGFDLIFSRLLIAGMHDWPKYIEIAASLLRPGSGWLEVHDMDWLFYDGSGNIMSKDWEWCHVLESECQAKGLETQCGSNVKRYMEQAGLVDIQRTSYDWRCGFPEDEEDEYMKQFAEYTRIEMPKLMFGFMKMLTAGKGYSEERMEDLRSQIRTSIAPGKGKHCKLWVTYGRRPE